MATGSSPPPPPPPASWKLTGIGAPAKPGDIRYEVGAWENSDIGFFIYLIDEKVIINALYDCKHESLNYKLKENEFLLIMDSICPQLHDRMCTLEFSSTYPIRGILIYETDKREEHAR